MERQAFYDLYDAYYANTIFEDPELWAGYIEQYELPETILPKINPTKRVVEWYVGKIFPGLLTEDGRPLPNKQLPAVPLAEDTDPALAAAISQGWQWSGWQSGKDLVVRLTGKHGNALTEIVDDVRRRKVYYKNWEARDVEDVVIDNMRNLKMFRVGYEVTVYDPNTPANSTPVVLDRYWYSRQVDGSSIQTFRNGVLWDFVNDVEAGEMAVRPHPYTFCPGGWWTQFTLGGKWGLPVMWGTLGKIDGVNALVTQIADQIDKIINTPMGVKTENSIKPLTDEARRQIMYGDNGNTDHYRGRAGNARDLRRARRERHKVIRMNPGDGFETPQFEIGPGMDVVRLLIDEVNQDRPELTYIEAIRTMSSTTGPAIEGLVGDVDPMYQSACGMYYRTMIELHHKLVAVGGFRANEGKLRGWGTPDMLTPAHKRFLPFNLDSYDAGKLNHTLVVRPLVPKSELTKWNEELAKANALTAKKDGLQIPVEQVQIEAGYTQKQIDKWAEERAENQADFGNQLLGALNAGGGFNPNPGAAGESDPANRSGGPNDAGNDAGDTGADGNALAFAGNVSNEQGRGATSGNRG
jgi:hypothetical protein